MAELDIAINPLEVYVPVVIQEHIFRHDVKRTRSQPGRRISEIMWENDLNPDEIHARVLIDDCVIEEAWWSRVKPKPGHIVTIRVIPQGSGAQGKDVLRIVAMVGVLALAVAAAVLFPPLLGATLGLSAGTAGTIGSLIGSGVLFWRVAAAQ